METLTDMHFTASAENGAMGWNPLQFCAVICDFLNLAFYDMGALSLRVNVGAWGKKKKSHLKCPETVLSGKCA